MQPETLDALRRYDTPTLSNAIETFDVRPRDEGFASHVIRALMPEMAPVVGYAITATIRSRGRAPNPDPSPLWAHSATVPGPRIAVVQDLDDPPGHGAFLGEITSTILKALGCVAAVTNGCVRDVPAARDNGFRFFARGVCVSHAYVRLEHVGHPVSVAGLQVRPGDLIHADSHGVLSIPLEIADLLPEVADSMLAREQTLIKWARSPEFTLEALLERRRRR